MRLEYWTQQIKNEKKHLVVQTEKAIKINLNGFLEQFKRLQQPWNISRQILN